MLVYASLTFAYQTVTVSDSIATDTHWTNDKQYLLMGYVYVTAGHTLTIDSGTIIKGDKNSKGTLIIERGAKIYANGTAMHPVIFTSNQPAGSRSYGDWGGVVLCGYSKCNWNGGTSQVEGGPRSLYGGTDIHDNSGKLSYVRVEFPGVALSPNNEINGISLYAIGDATQLDHIQVSYSGDDALEFFGGTVNTKYVVTYRTWDDDFDTDNGYQGKNQFGVVIRDPYAADNSGSKGFESDSYQNGTYSGIPVDLTMMTRPVFSNCTVIGPMISPTSTAWDPQFVAGAHIRRGSACSILNSVFLGWPCGVLIDESSSAFGSTSANIALGELQFRNNIIAGTATNSTPNPKDIVYVINGARSLTATTVMADTTTGSPFSPFAGPWSFIKNSAFHNKIYSTSAQTDVRLQNPFNLNSPNETPTSTSPICFNSAHTFNPLLPINTDTTNNYANYNVPAVAPDFTNNKASDPFFTHTNYIGAFSGTQTTADNWFNEGWTNFDCQNTDYNYVLGTNGIKNVTSNVASVLLFPNPAQNAAQVHVSLETPGNVKIQLVDLTGKVVKVLANEERLSGAKFYALDLSDVQSGMYIVNIISNNTQKNIKLSVIK